MDCPVCKVPLIVVERQEIEIDYCISCRGMWFDEGEIELLSEKVNIRKLEHMEFHQSDSATEKPRRCPRCDKNMNKVTIGDKSGFLLDKCPDNQGIWFDAGELSKATRTVSGSQNGYKSELINFLGEIIKIDT